MLPRLRVLCCIIRGPSRSLRASSYLVGPKEYPLVRMTLGQALDETVRNDGDRTGFHFPAEGLSLTFASFGEQVERLAQGLRSLDLEPGCRIGILSPTCHRWIVSQFAAAKAGFVLVPINDKCHPNELESVLTRTACSALMVGNGFKKTDHAQWAQELVADKKFPLDLPKYPDLKYLISLTTGNAARGLLQFEELLRIGDGSSRSLSKANEDPYSTVTMLQSSGSTGPPKIIPLSHFNVLNAVHILKIMSGFSSKKTIMCAVMPLFHAFGHIDLSIFGVVVGVPTVYVPQGATPEQTLEAIQRYRCTAIQGTPTTYYDLMQCREFNKYDTSSLCEGLVGATSVQAPVLEMIVDKLKMDNLMTGYGLTETAGPIGLGYQGKLGYHPAPHTEIRVVDASESVLPAGEIGEVQVRGPSVFSGYWKHSVTGLSGNGWLPTGDQGVVSDQGTFEIKGRIKDLVIKGGVNISPEEVERALLGHDAILEASVVGVPDARLGEEVCAWVRLRKGAVVDIQRLQQYCRTKVNSLKVPKYVVIVDDFPRTSVGKVSKPDIRKAMAEKLSQNKIAAPEAA